MGLENIARKILVREGVGAIWQLHLAAARAYRDGQKAAATGDYRDCRRCGAGVAARGWARRIAWPLVVETEHLEVTVLSFRIKERPFASLWAGEDSRFAPLSSG
jgi:hypothetical protein